MGVGEGWVGGGSCGGGEVEERKGGVGDVGGWVGGDWCVGDDG